VIDRDQSADQVVILGAGRGVRGSVPSAIVDIDDHTRVMDWLLDAFAALDNIQVCFVGGFKADEVVERYPQVRTVFNREWAHTGPVSSLGLVPDDRSRHTYACYSDVVFRRSAVAALRDAVGEVVVAVDTKWRSRYDARSRRDLAHAEKVRLADRSVREIGPRVDTDAADAEFAGVLRLSGEGKETAFAAIRAGELAPAATLPDLIRHLLERGFEVTAVDLEGDWAELDAKQDLARFILGTKAESLERLRKMNHGGEIGALVSFTFGDWRADRDRVIDRVFAEIPAERLIVRSSALLEDSWFESRAGRHDSVLDVARTEDALSRAVDKVFASYGSDEAGNQVLVQEMLEGVALSGVVMTRHHALGAPYYVLNFDDTTARTDTVTGGGDARSVFLHRGASLRADLPPQLASVLAVVQNIEHLVGHDSLDIEFAVTGAGRVHVLQVRPIAVTRTPQPIDDDEIAGALSEARRFLGERTAPSPTLVGRTTRYSVMTDWNPAEIVGTNPKRLAMTLYRYLITDEVWAQQRAEYGYRDVRPCPLLVEIVGHPYVDVRASFNSFVPASLSDGLATRLVEHYLADLAARPSLHDKVEFDVVFTCLTVDFDKQATRLRDAGFSTGEIDQLRESLQTITQLGFDRLDGYLAQLPVLEARVQAVQDSRMPPLDRAFHHLETARRFGTLVFAHLARSAFVATSLLRSLENEGVIGAVDTGAFLASIETVLGRMQADGQRVKAGELGWDEFVDRYGHLRPGTYDITSPRYRSAPEEYLRPVVERTLPLAGSASWDGWSTATRRAIRAALRRAGLPPDVERFESFARRSIAAREEGKFVFTKALSHALECVAAFGESNGQTRDDLAHVGIVDLLACRDALSDPASFLARRVLEGREAHNVAQGICLPGQIATDVDLVCFEQQAAEPNFVTQRTVEAPVTAFDLGPSRTVDGTIVLIPNADPGYDWLLARDIGGLITMYGGANSHMAVRAAELGIPAAIGVGELLYRDLEPATVIRLDCASRTIMAVR
jgi:choline kinase/phosphohistidine swiveling domain-containing protein